MQVSNAEGAGATAAIVYDDKYEALIIMSKPINHPSPGIPAVFISQKSGVVLKRLMTPGVSVVQITPVRAALRGLRQAADRGAVPLWAAACPGRPLRGCGLQMMDAVWLSMLLSASAGMLAVTVVVSTFYFIRCGAGPALRAPSLQPPSNKSRRGAASSRRSLCRALQLCGCADDRLQALSRLAAGALGGQGCWLQHRCKPVAPDLRAGDSPDAHKVALTPGRCPSAGGSGPAPGLVPRVWGSCGGRLA